MVRVRGSIQRQAAAIPDLNGCTLQTRPHHTHWARVVVEARLFANGVRDLARARANADRAAKSKALRDSLEGDE
eukprot:6946928-Alexandrium_andersonii.AAC.1